MINKNIVKEVLIKENLKEALKYAKKGYDDLAMEYLLETKGAIRYMWLTKDMTDSNRNRINNLIRMIIHKYKLYQ